MKTVALISGGKDSCFNMMCCAAEGHDIVALANLRPESGIDELDSYMFQTVGHTAIDLYAEAMGLPLFARVIKGKSLATGLDYSPEDGDEVEDLYKLLATVKNEVEIEAVSVGAILSDYQRIRVENVCSRLGLTVLSFLWRRNQEILLKEMIDCHINARIIKVAALGLHPETHLGMTLDEIYPHMMQMKEKYGLNVCGEGGEYETFVTDCPLFTKRIRITKIEQRIHADDAFAPVGYINILECHLEEKEDVDSSRPLKERILDLPMTTKTTWVQNRLEETNEQEGQSKPEPEGIVVCVPEWKIGENDDPVLQTDGVNFQVSKVEARINNKTDVKGATEKAFLDLKESLNKANLRSEDIASVSLYINDMSNYAAINNVYIQFFTINPPVRLCIQANLPPNVVLQLDCQGRTQKAEGDRRCMHVQALSHWAPANIGPYSQAVVTGDKLFVAGIVPLVPATLAVVPGGINTQCFVGLRHLKNVITAIESKCTLSSCPLAMCYLTSQEFVENAREEWNKSVEASDVEEEKRKLTPQIQYCTVPALPKGVAVEWHVYAWPHLSEDCNIQEISLTENHTSYRLSAKAVYCEDQKELFSCRIVAEVESLEHCASVDPSQLSVSLLELYCRVLKRRESQEMPPLVKILFSPLTFRYPLLHKCFSDAIESLKDNTIVGPPVLSFVPVTGLETCHQILAWCQ